MSSRERGFSLVELAVSLAVLMLALALAAQLLLEAQLSFLRSGRSALDPLPDLALRQLRHDVQGARQAVGSTWWWSSGPLGLRLPDGRSVRYAWNDDRLERQLLDPTGAPIGRRVVLQGVISWRWHQAAPGLLELEVVVQRHLARTGVLFTGPNQLAALPPVAETLHLQVALRGMLGAKGW